ncbi:3-isopropylmalate dehydratase [Thermoplasmatales archaeon ex4572_165]|nr:MAG: 3-isopropylmalate dehydratase [Thermoplasmatales archaeon ex4572_165]RLF58046.1 MAG: 3-isopropylmalate dehydratase [Thermoplasmata archaeon]
MNVWKYGDDINTDMLFPGKYTYTCSTAEEIKPHLLEDLDPTFSGKVKKGDIIFGGKNFGCGSSREQPVVGLKAVGIQAVVAKSFARIFYRSAINQGLLLIESSDAVESYQSNDEVTLDIEKGIIMINDKTFSFPTLPSEILAIQDAGGLLNYTRNKLKEQ